MAWDKREVPNNFVTLGAKPGNKKKVGGILVRFVPNTKYKDKTDYEYIDKDGELWILSGSATLARQLVLEDQGKFFKAEYLGEGESPNGKFKQIEVNVWSGDPTPEMKQWPGYLKYYRPADQPVAAGSFEQKPEVLENEDEDDLPF